MVVGVVRAGRTAGNRDRALHARVGVAWYRADEAQAAGWHVHISSLGLFGIGGQLGAVGEGYVVLKRAIIRKFDGVASRFLNLQIRRVEPQIDAVDLKRAKCRPGRLGRGIARRLRRGRRCGCGLLGWRLRARRTQRCGRLGRARNP